MTPQKILINHLNPSSLLRRGWVLILLAVGSFALSPQVRAACDTPDPGCPGGNLAEGFLALGGLTAGFYNTGIGTYSLLTVSDASFDTAVGAGALFSDNGGTNTGVGAGALFSNTTGAFNNALGAFALFSNIDGEFNNAVGRNSLLVNSNGIENNAMGDDAMFNNTTGSRNTALGDDALFSCTTGNSNVVVGDEAGSSIDDASDNVIVGSGAGGNLVSDGNNVYIGTNVQGPVDETRFIRIGDTSFTDFDCFIAGIFGREIDGGTAVLVGIDANQKLGTVAVNANGISVPFKPQAMLNESLKQQQRIAELEVTVTRLAAMVKEQAAQIQKVSAQLEVNKPAPQVVANKP
jgi:hypothetical protein